MAQVASRAKVPAPRIGESPMRPKRLLVVPAPREINNDIRRRFKKRTKEEEEEEEEEGGHCGLNGNVNTRHFKMLQQNHLGIG